MELRCHTGSTPCPPPSVLKAAKVFPPSAKPIFGRRSHAASSKNTRGRFHLIFWGHFCSRIFPRLHPISCGRLGEGPWSRELVSVCVCRALGWGQLHPCSIPRATHRANEIIFYVYESGSVPLQDLVDFQRMSQRIIALRYVIGFDYSL